MMKGIWGRAALAAAVAFASVQPAQACWNSAEQDAAKIAKLNMMLMSTSLRCRFGADDFQDTYSNFVRQYNPVMGVQHGVLQAHFAQTMSNYKAGLALDSLMVNYANTYGVGHKTMDCAALKTFARKIVDDRLNAITLAAAADKVVGSTDLPGATCPVTIAGR